MIGKGSGVLGDTFVFQEEVVGLVATQTTLLFMIYNPHQLTSYKGEAVHRLTVHYLCHQIHDQTGRGDNKTAGVCKTYVPYIGRSSLGLLTLMCHGEQRG